MSPWTALPPRQTAASTALMPYARPWRYGQAPQPRSGAPKAHGLTASHTVAAPSPVPSSTVNFFTAGRRPIDTTNNTAKLHQLDGRYRYPVSKIRLFGITPQF